MAPKVMGEKDGELVQLFGWDTEAAGKEYSEFLHQFLAALKPELEKLGISEAKAYSVASFYENFSFEPKGKYVIKVCDGTACHVRKSAAILDAFMKELGLSDKKHTTDDMLFTVETVSCLGACGLAPTCTVNDEVHPNMTPEKVVGLITELRGEC